MGASSLKGIQVKWIYDESVIDDAFYKKYSCSYYIIVLAFVYDLKGMLPTLQIFLSDSLKKENGFSLNRVFPLGNVLHFPPYFLGIDFSVLSCYQGNFV